MRLSKNQLLIAIKAMMIFLLLVLQLPVMAESSVNINILLSSEAKPYQTFANSLYLHLQNKNVHINITTITDKPVYNKNSIIIPVGFDAAKLISKEDIKNPIIYSLISEKSYKELTSKSNQPNTTAIYINQSWERQFATINYITPSLRNISVLYTNNTKHLVPEIKNAAGRLKINIDAYQVNESDNIIKIVNKALHKNHALLAIPDHKIFNNNTAKNILYAVYKLKKPLIAYSKNYVQAGALLSVYSTLENYAQQTAEITNNLLSSGNRILPAADFPEYFEIQINKSVAQSLDIKYTNIQKQKELIH